VGRLPDYWRIQVIVGEANKKGCEAMNQNQKDILADALGISPQDRAILDRGGNHGYHCRCNQCLQWWVLMGPDGMEPGAYGPFTRDEVLAEAKRMGRDDISYLI
jgi:hypothetical protein